MSDNIRFDSVKLPKMTKTKEGYLRGQAVVSRAGVFKYRNVDGSIRGELRHPDDIFKQDSLETLKMIPITNDHPPEFVHAGNVHRYQVGYTGERYDIADDKVIVSMTVTHQDAIDAIQSGKLELSMGYNVILKPEEGVYEGTSYDARQLEPKYNHLAIVKKGRAGSEARFRFDKAYELVEAVESEEIRSKKIKTVQQQESSQGSEQESKESSINKIKNDFDMTLDMTKENTGRIDILTAENEQLAAKISSLQSKLDEAEKSCEATKDELEKEKALKTDSVIESKVMDRVMLLSKAAPFLGEIKDCYRKTDREIMETVISLVHTDAIDFKNYSDDYVKGVFEASVSTARQHMDANNNVYSVVMNGRNTDGGSAYDINMAIAESLKDRKGRILKKTAL